MADTRCPFFGKRADVERRRLIESNPLNRTDCALQTGHLRPPCYLDAHGQRPELAACEWNGSARAHDFIQFPTEQPAAAAAK